MKQNGSIVLDAAGIRKAVERIAHEILERNKDLDTIVVIGIKTRGAFLAGRLAEHLTSFNGKEILLGALDITLYRDDLTQVAEQPVMHATEIDFDLKDRHIVLVDDVLYTGRTIRCALDALIDFGRPAKIELAVLIDRGHRELPIRADYVGKNIPTSKEESVRVKMVESDGVDEVIVEGPHG